MTELVVDLFCGGGGASAGISHALGRFVDIAIDNNAQALNVHAANHPKTKHYCADVFDVDPIEATGGMPVGLLWASPDCKHFSRAKGSQPVNEKVRGLAWVVVKWAKAVRPRIIMLENVEEFQTWGPLGTDNQPIASRGGETFHRWVEELRNLGYRVEWDALRASSYGVPTIRKRLFVVARCDGRPIRWPSKTHGDPRRAETSAHKMKTWIPAASCIDWSLPVKSIFDREKPLAETTMKRIALGIEKFSVCEVDPFIVSTTHGEVSAAGVKRWGTGARSIHAPLQTVLAGGNSAAICIPFFVKYYGNERDGVSLSEPMHTIPTRDRFCLVSALIEKYLPEKIDSVLPRFGLAHVIINGEVHVIADVGIRMLQPHELYKAQGFPDNYKIDIGADGKKIPKSAQVRICGNSVCPPMASLLVAANY